jgi:hypothetical protein
MFEICYYSTAANDLEEYDIDAILEKARSNNLRYQITGCLLFHNNKFVQIIEGYEMAVKTLFSKIENDSRHRFIQKLYEGRISERLFSEWDMAFYRFNQTESKNNGKSIFIDNFLTFSELKSNSTIASKLFWMKAKEILVNV